MGRHGTDRMRVTGDNVYSFNEPTLTEPGEIVLSADFPYKPLKNVVLTTSRRVEKKLRILNVNLGEASKILNSPSNHGYRSEDKTILVTIRNGKYDYVVIGSESKNIITIILQRDRLPKRTDLTPPLW